MATSLPTTETRAETLNYGRDKQCPEITLYSVGTSPRYRPPVTGYGHRIQTPYVVKFRNRVYRVYCACFGNIGTCYFEAKGTRHIVG